MEITGKLVAILEPITGTSAKGNWKKVPFVIETAEQYPKKVAMQSFKEEPIAFIESAKVGQVITAHINIESREYQGRWYTDILAWKIQGAEAASAGSGSTRESVSTSESDDLPF